MTTEQGSFGDSANVDAVVATREDQMTSSGLSDAPYRGDTGGDTPSGDRLQDAAGGVVDRVAGTAQQQVGGTVNTQLGRAADTIDQVCQAIRRTGDELRGEQPQIASFADMAATQVERAGELLRKTDFQGLLREGEGFARRQPALFLGGAFALGIAASRFLKASPQGGGGRQFGGYGGGSRAYRPWDDDGRRSGASGGYGSSMYAGSGGSAGSTYGTGYGTGTGSDAYSAGTGTYGAAADAGSTATGDTPGAGSTSDEGAGRGGI